MFLLLIISGTKDSKFNSKPIQAVNQFVEETEIKVPMIDINKNKRFRLFIINKVYSMINYIMVFKAQKILIL